MVNEYLHYNLTRFHFLFYLVIQFLDMQIDHVWKKKEQRDHHKKNAQLNFRDDNPNQLSEFFLGFVCPNVFV